MNTLPGFLLPAVLLIAGGTGLMGSLDDTGESVEPLPFDPPKDVERAMAANTALSDSRVQEAIGERHALLGVALGTEKVPGVPVAELTRVFDVWFYNYSSNHAVQVVVDPAAQHVVDLIPASTSVYLPLAGIEVERARELALQLDVVTDRFPDPLPVTASLVAGEGTPCTDDRCAIIAFIEDEGPVTEYLILINLSQDRPIEIFHGWEEVFQ